MAMTNKYAGECVDCGGYVAAGRGRTWKSGRRWQVSHGGSCKASFPVEGSEHEQRLALTVRHPGLIILGDGTEIFQNPRGRCEDAPCCGCCS